MKRIDLTELQLLKQLELIEMAENCFNSTLSFWDFCNSLAPDFYLSNKDTPHLYELCELLQAFYECRIIRPRLAVKKKLPWKVVQNKPSIPHDVCNSLMINMPPQHGKTRTLILFSMWVFGKNNQERIIAGAYNNDVASDFGRYTRDGIAEEKNLENQLVYSDIFPNTKIKKGNSSYMKWALEGQFFNFLSTGLGGSVTGKGATIKIIDDLIKGIEEATNATHLEKVWLWYNGTFGSRNAANNQGESMEIMCFTRWSEEDPCGRLLADPKERDNWYIHLREAYDHKTDTMLCPAFLSKEKYMRLKHRYLQNPVTALIFWANYHQKTVDEESRLYKRFSNYNELPEFKQYETTKCYIDTADTGQDYLCAIAFKMFMGKAYVIDLLYTQEGMDKTQGQVANFIQKNDIHECVIEGNNGGKEFAKIVKAYLTQNLGYPGCYMKTFKQTKNKQSRIYTMALTVQEDIVYPSDWAVRWPYYYTSMYKYQMKGKNEHDDAQDATTGVAEMVLGKLNRLEAIINPLNA